MEDWLPRPVWVAAVGSEPGGWLRTTEFPLVPYPVCRGVLNSKTASQHVQRAAQLP